MPKLTSEQKEPLNAFLSDRVRRPGHDFKRKDSKSSDVALGMTVSDRKKEDDVSMLKFAGKD